MQNQNEKEKSLSKLWKEQGRQCSFTEFADRYNKSKANNTFRNADGVTDNVLKNVSAPGEVIPYEQLFNTPFKGDTPTLAVRDQITDRNGTQVFGDKEVEVVEEKPH